MNERLTLAPGQEATVAGAGFRLVFVRVSGDSRCPADAICVQGGDAIVHLRVLDTGAGATEYQLHTGDSSRAAVTHHEARITLTQLDPYPFSSRPIAPNEYRATLTIVRP